MFWLKYIVPTYAVLLLEFVYSVYFHTLGGEPFFSLFGFLILFFSLSCFRWPIRRTYKYLSVRRRRWATDYITCCICHRSSCTRSTIDYPSAASGPWCRPRSRPPASASRSRPGTARCRGTAACPASARSRACRTCSRLRPCQARAGARWCPFPVRRPPRPPPSPRLARKSAGRRVRLVLRAVRPPVPPVPVPCRIAAQLPMKRIVTPTQHPAPKTPSDPPRRRDDRTDVSTSYHPCARFLSFFSNRSMIDAIISFIQCNDNITPYYSDS